jgi:uncharacterized protein YbjT (DUF2867 family)
VVVAPGAIARPEDAAETIAVAVTGVTGALGSRIAARLAGHGVPQLLVGRSPDRMPELPGAQRRGLAAYAEAADMRRALEGASTLILVSGHRTGRRLEEHATAVEAAIAVGVGRVLYVSLVSAAPTATCLNARDQWLTEQSWQGPGSATQCSGRASTRRRLPPSPTRNLS